MKVNYPHRYLLHKSKLEKLKEWLKNNGYEILPTKGTYEVLRAKKDKNTVIIFTRENAKEHYSVQGKDIKLIREFIRDSKELQNG